MEVVIYDNYVLKNFKKSYGYKKRYTTEKKALSLLNNLNGKKNFINRLGEQTIDPIDEFMNLALSYETKHIPSLQGFLQWINSDELIIKRELDQSEDNLVRIMTAHSSKGLQAPIVILPDCLQNSSKSPNIFFDEEKIFYFGTKTKKYNQYLENLKQNNKQIQNEEKKRLLYVAMTRAEDRLYITAWNNKKAAIKENWYEIIQEAIKKIGTKKTQIFASTKEYGTYPNEVISYQTKQLEKVESKNSNDASYLSDINISFPNWLKNKPINEQSSTKTLSPSKADEQNAPPAFSPLKHDDSYKYLRGNLIHKMLEIIPNIEKKLHKTSCKNFLDKFAPDLTNDQKENLIKETLSVIYNENFCELFMENSKAEVPIIGKIEDKTASGIIDRIVILKDEVIIVDYKTNRPPPKNVDDTPKIYIKQLSIYKKILSDIYPNKKITCTLLWTDIPKLMHIPDKKLIF
jgi:ATP-dependent helicase/nuclease subunit A